MAIQRTFSRSQPPVEYSETQCTSSAAEVSRAIYLEQILLAFRDIADYDDIHQAAKRLQLVQQWIRDEAEQAARDPIFRVLQPA